MSIAALRLALLALSGAQASPWTPTHGGHLGLLHLEAAPFPCAGSPWVDDTVAVWVPADTGPERPVGIATHLHGHHTTISDVIGPQGLPAQVAASGRRVVWIAPQGPVDAASGSFGCLVRPGGHQALVDEVLRHLRADGLLREAPVARVVLTAHSGGYRAAARLAATATPRVDEIHLYDALYGEVDAFAEFARSGGTLRVATTPHGGTTAGANRLARRLQSQGLGVLQGVGADQAPRGPVVFVATAASHVDVLTEGGRYGRWLASSGAPAVDGAR